MIHWQRLTSLCLILIFLLVGCTSEAQTPTPTQVTGEPITFYVGSLDNSTDMIGLVVSTTRFRAAVCTDNPDRWRALNTWIRDGVVSENGTQLSSAALTAQLLTSASASTLQGSYHATDGITYPFTAQKVATTEDYERDEPEENRAVYSILNIPLTNGSSADFYIIVANAETSIVCAMLLQNGLPISRVVPIGRWQAGFTPFELVDLPDPAGTPVQWSSPRLLSKVIRITLPQS